MLVAIIASVLVVVVSATVALRVRLTRRQAREEAELRQALLQSEHEGPLPCIRHSQTPSTLPPRTVRWCGRHVSQPSTRTQEHV